MNSFSDITDDEFVPFLRSLGVETYGKSFEWMLSDSDFGCVFRWFYNNFDHNNALTPREDYRYIEIKKRGALLSQEELEKSVMQILEEHPGLVLPGDHDSLEDMQLDVQFIKERLNMLKHHEETVDFIIKQNELAKEELTREITELNSVEKQCTEDINSDSEKCLALAEEVEMVTDDVVDLIADVMSAYSNAQLDMEMSKKFFTFGPFEAYKQSQRLFKSHLHLYCSRKFNRKQIHPSDVNTKKHLVQAKSMEKRLLKAILDYVELQAEMEGGNAIMQFLANYEDVHVNQIPISMMEATSAIELLEQEELILKRQIQDMAKCNVEARTKATAECATIAALKQREEIYKDLCWLVDLSQNALSLDKLVYHAIRRELSDCQDLMQFATELHTCVMEDQAAVASRIESMRDIKLHQESAEEGLQKTDKLLEIISSVLNMNASDGVSGITKKYSDMKNELCEIEDAIKNEFHGKENRLKDIIKSTESVRKYLSDGCTRLPNCWDSTVAALSHALKHEIGNTDRKIIEASEMYATVKKGDKQNLRKLWQWFLTDPSKLMSKVKEVQCTSYC